MGGSSSRNFASRAAEGWPTITDLRILEGIPDAVTVQDAAGRLVFANEAAARGLGLGDPSIEGEAVESLAARFEILDESGEPIAKERLPSRLALAGVATTGTILRIRRPGDGEERWAAATAWPVRDESGAVEYAVSVFTDITERRQREEALLQRLAFQSDASEALGSSLDYGTIAAHVAKLAVPSLADWCIVYMLQRDGALRRLAMEHRDPS